MNRDGLQFFTRYPIIEPDIRYPVSQIKPIRLIPSSDSLVFEQHFDKVEAIVAEQQDQLVFQLSLEGGKGNFEL